MMKEPNGIDQVSISGIDIPLGPYPSLGFVPIYEAELGNGDYYGLYWPLGKEKTEPIICDMLHDEWTLEPSFSSLKKFIEWLDVNDWERGEEEIEDEEFAPQLFHKSQLLFAGSDLQAAIELLKKTCNSFSEVSGYWFALYSQLRRTGEIEEAASAVLKAFNSNWVFGLPSEGVLRALKNPNLMETQKNDPLAQRAQELALSFGGEKKNSTYPVMLECVQEYFQMEKYIEGLTLYQNYGYMMYSETKSFQERYQFDLEKWQAEYSKLCLKHLGDNRKYCS